MTIPASATQVALPWRLYILGGHDCGEVFFKLGTSLKYSADALRKANKDGYGGVCWKECLYWGVTPVRQQFDQAVLRHAEPPRRNGGARLIDGTRESWAEQGRYPGKDGSGDASEVIGSDFWLGSLFKPGTYTGGLERGGFGYADEIEFKEHLGQVYKHYSSFGLRNLQRFIA